MKKLNALSALALAAGLALAGCAADKPMHDASMHMKSGAGMQMGGADAAPVTVGGAPMYASRDIVDNAVNSKDHTTLVAAVKAAGLVDTLKGAGPFTVFAPTNAAFAALPAGTVDTLLKPENKADADQGADLPRRPRPARRRGAEQRIAAGGGKATLKTVAGGMLHAP